MSSNAETWSAVAGVYSDGIARATGDGGKALLEIVERLRPITSSSLVLDSGAGTGVLTEMIVRRAEGVSVIAGDVAPGMLQVLDKKQLPQVKTLTLDATKDHVAQGVPASSCTHAVTSFMVQFISPAHTAVDEMYHILQPGGVAGVAIWSQNQVAEPWEVACKSVDPDFEIGNVISSEAWRTAEDVESAMAKSGFESIISSETDVTLVFDSAEAYAEYFLTSNNPPFVRAIKSWKGDVEDVKPKFVEVVREQYDNGKIKMVAACVAGRKPL